jgi:ABC-type uncharacterized transport system permease subunit
VILSLVPSGLETSAWWSMVAAAAAVVIVALVLSVLVTSAWWSMVAAAAAVVVIALVLSVLETSAWWTTNGSEPIALVTTKGWIPFVDTIRLKAEQGPRSGQTQLATQCLLRAELL